VIFINFFFDENTRKSISRAKHWQITLVHLWYSIQGLHIMANDSTKIVVQVTNAINGNNFAKQRNCFY
jgi:hypothetical protein